jgi:putative ABC transport system permease protein
MFRNYLLTALRSLRKNPVFTFINIAGLSLGMTAFIFIFQYISFERSVDIFHTMRPNLYRVLYEETIQGKTETLSATPPGFAPAMKEKFPDVTEYCRVMPGIGNGIVLLDDNRSFREEHTAYVDGNFFKLFTFNTLIGNPDALKQPNNIAIAQSIAKKYFNSENPIGKVITLNNQFGAAHFTITSVYEDFPLNSDFKFTLIPSLQTFSNTANLNGNDWAALDNLSAKFIETYFVLQPGVDYKALEAKLNTEKEKLRPGDNDFARLQRFSNVHLAASLSDVYPTSGSLKFIYILEGIAALILIIAWFNYINLSTAGALKRAKEVGLRKAIGASRKQLVRQFLGESLLINIMSLLFAIAIVNVLQPLYNQLIQRELSFSVFNQNTLWFIGTIAIVVGSIGSGSYSAFVLSSFKPSQILKGVFSKSTSGILMRKSLVVFQFTISILLIASTIILYRQLQFMHNSDLGVSMEKVLSINEPEVGRDSTFRKRNRAFLNALSQQSFVEDYAMSGSVPGKWYNYSTPGYTSLNPQPDDEKINYSILFIDERYLHLFNIGQSAGTSFTPEMCSKPWEQVDKIMVNESAVRKLGFASPEIAVGQKVTDASEAKKYGGTVHEYEIIGVVKDYHHMSLQQEINPVIYFPMYNSHYYTVKLAGDQLKPKLEKLESLYKEMFPGNPFEFFFVDEQYDKQYKSEQQYGSVFSVASGLAIFIACLGLFGLATYTVDQRKKEIGIRKVLGANVAQITQLFSADFLKLVGLSIIIATPLSWYIMDKWLQEFAYRTQIAWWIFGIAGLIAVLIALFTISSQAIKAAISNPVDSLKQE